MNWPRFRSKHGNALGIILAVWEAYEYGYNIFYDGEATVTSRGPKASHSSALECCLIAACE